MSRYLLFIIFCFFSLCLNASNGANLPKTALIFGITGQDGAYLTDFLLSKGYIVHGVKRRSSSPNTSRIDHHYEEKQKATRFFLHYGDLSDGANIFSIIQSTQPDEIYNLAAQSHVMVSFEMPEYTGDIDGLGTLRILEAVRAAGLTDKTRYYQASTSELYGKVQEIPQTEKTPFYPRSPYATAKLYAYWSTVNYRESYGMFACNGILFNHESPLRGETFVTRKITLAACRCKAGIATSPLFLGNLNAKRDWGFAKDYVEAMWLMLQQDNPEDYVIASGEMHSVREFVELSFAQLGIDIEWRGEGVNEVGIDPATNQTIVQVDPRYFRPAEVDLLLGNPQKARQQLGWKPKTSFSELVRMMIESDYQIALKEAVFLQ